MCLRTVWNEAVGPQRGQVVNLPFPWPTAPVKGLPGSGWVRSYAPLPSKPIMVLRAQDQRGCGLQIYPPCVQAQGTAPPKKIRVKVVQSCPTLCNPIDCSPPGSSVHGILQARILEWIAIPFSRGSSWCRAQTQVSWIVGRFFIIWATREASTRPLPKASGSLSRWG